MYLLRLLFLVCGSLRLASSGSSSGLFGYTFDQSIGGRLISLNPSTGESVVVCKLSRSIGPLSSSSSCSDLVSSKIYFFQNPANGTLQHFSSSNLPLLVSLDVSACLIEKQVFRGLSPGQDTVYDLKFNYKTGSMYATIPNPNCIDGSLDRINASNARVITHIIDIVDSTGVQHKSGLSFSGTEGTYFSISFQFEKRTTFSINAVDLSNATTRTVLFVNDTMSIEATNYTMAVWDGPSGPVAIGAYSNELVLVLHHRHANRPDRESDIDSLHRNRSVGRRRSDRWVLLPDSGGPEEILPADHVRYPEETGGIEHSLSHLLTVVDFECLVIN